MPSLQVMAKRANAALTREGLAGIDPEAFAPGRPLVDSLWELGIVGDEREADYLLGFPSGLLEAVRALLYDNATSAQPLDVTFAWAPGYDDELSLWQVADTDRTRGGITVFVRSRYPDDRTGLGRGITPS